MTKNTQEYINNLLNKHKTSYLDLSSPCQVSQCSHCNKKTWNENANLSGEIEDLSEFQNLKSINASNSKFTRLEGIFTLPNKEKVEKLNLFGNKIGEVDLAKIFTEFPNLKYLNLDRNPLSAKNLENLTSEQLEKLAEGMKDKKIRISAGQGTMMADLLEYTQKLIKKGGGSSSSAHKLQTILQNGSVKSEQQNNNSKLPWIIGGVAVVSLVLVVGYFVGKKKSSQELDD